MKYNSTNVLILLFLLLTGCKSDPSLYLNPNQPINKRVDNLLSQMTLEEKVAQMCQYVGVKHMKSSEKHMTIEEMRNSHARGFYPSLHSSEVEKMVEEGLIGSFLHVTDFEEANHLQTLALKSRLKIPLLIGIDAIHGNGLCKGVTIYPTPLGQASTFSPELVEKASRQTALEVRATGAHWAFTPNVDIARDPRWGRVGETFGEDPYLVSQMGVSTVKGLQGELVSKRVGKQMMSKVMNMKEALYPGSPYATHYLIEALLKCDMKEEAKNYLINYWGAMVTKGADTFWEVYDPKNEYASPYKFFPMNSYCHAWSCTPVYFIRKYPDVFQK